MYDFSPPPLPFDDVERDISPYYSHYPYEVGVVETKMKLSTSLKASLSNIAVVVFRER